MEDSGILELYFLRNEQALRESDRKYGAYCGAIAYGILQNREDTEETVNDTWLSAWNAIPPRRPECLKGFLGRITRNGAIDRWRRRTAEKRGGEMVLALEELGGVYPLWGQCGAAGAGGGAGKGAGSLFANAAGGAAAHVPDAVLVSCTDPGNCPAAGMDGGESSDCAPSDPKTAACILTGKGNAG